MERRDFIRSLSFSLAGSSAAEVFSPVDALRSDGRRVEFEGVPVLSDEAAGWLAHLHRKVSLPGRWRKGEQVQEAWDTRSFRPTMAYPRYELTWLAWGIGLMAETTPAWRETYVRILKYASERFMEYHALNEWVEQRGPDPNRANYPKQLEPVIPRGRFGSYDAPGWAGNGRAPHPYDPDPLRAGGHFNLMYKGYMNFVHSLYRYVSGDASLERGYTVEYDAAHRYPTSQRALNALLARQWRSHRSGIACEVTKIYPWCNMLSGSGVLLYDRIAGTSFARDFLPWLSFMRERFISRDSAGRITNLIGYFDDEINDGLTDPARQSGTNWAVTAWSGLPTAPGFFQQMYEGSLKLFLRDQGDGTAYMSKANYTDAPAETATGLTAALAAELGDAVTQTKLRAYIDAHYQPTWDNARGEFYYRFGLNEAWPRGQMNAWVMPAQSLHTAGQWSGIFQKPNLRKFQAPTLEGVEFPALRVRQAHYDERARVLRVAVTCRDATRTGQPTVVQIANLPRQSPVRVSVDGAPATSHQATRGRLPIALRMGAHSIEVQLG